MPLSAGTRSLFQVWSVKGKRACLDIEGQTVTRSPIFYVAFSSPSVAAGLHLKTGISFCCSDHHRLEAHAEETGLGVNDSGISLTKSSNCGQDTWRPEWESRGAPLRPSGNGRHLRLGQNHFLKNPFRSICSTYSTKMLYNRDSRNVARASTYLLPTYLPT